MELYEVGGCVRDEILGIKSKDIDFSVVLDQASFLTSGEEGFQAMSENLTMRGFKIFLETPEYFTIRARFPDTGWEKYKGLTADFVMARSEGEYTDGRRPDEVYIGTLRDDLQRRDFRMNAIAKDIKTGKLIDPFDGQKDIEDKVIRAVGDPLDRFREDALRAIRALRFSVTKGFDIWGDVEIAMQHPEVLNALATNISPERIREELEKMFKHDTLRTLGMLEYFPALTDVMFSGPISLMPTMKQKGFNNG